VVAWGNNQYGQTTVPVAAQSGVTAVAAGYHHTVALKNDGSVVAWGNNQYGQTTVPAAAQSGVSAIAAGGYHTVALKNDGSVVAWGNNQWGQRTVPLAAQSGVTAVAAGELHTVALKNDGSVLAWGNNQSGQTTVPVAAQSGVTAIAARSHNSFALVIPTAPNITTQPVSQAVNVWQSTSFTVAATGYYLNYQWRKDGVDLAGATNPTYHLPYAHTNDAGNYTVVVSNSVGSVTSAPPAVLTVNPVAPGSVVAWGSQTDVPIAAQSGVVAIAIAASAGVSGVSRDANTVALKDDGSVVAWGSNCCDLTNVPVAARSGVTAIAAGRRHTVALKNDGTVVAWGWNYNAQVTGTPTTNAPYSTTASPVTLGGQVLSGVTAIAAGDDYTVALKNDGSVVAWGYNDFGQVTGTPPTEAPYYAIASPVTLEGQVLSGVTGIAAGYSHTVALKNDGSVVAWGNTYHGETTVPVAAQSGVTAIAAGFGHTVALKNDGSVVAWGYNRDGQVTGTPTFDDPPSAIASPVTLEGQVLSGVTAIAASAAWLAPLGDPGSHTVALKNDGTVVAWGYNPSGQVTGTPTTDVSAIASPVTLGGQVLSGVTAIAAGHFQTVALIGGVQLLPSLKARPNGNELILSWPTNAPGFTLQSTPDLTPPVTWLDSTNVPAVIGAYFTLTNTPSGGARFYRLRKM
jgi:alpha-tubulin suppressor-like RCC1 family protein